MFIKIKPITFYTNKTSLKTNVCVGPISYCGKRGKS